jgi:hypothetical protein
MEEEVWDSPCGGGGAGRGDKAEATAKGTDPWWRRRKGRSQSRRSQGGAAMHDASQLVRQRAGKRSRPDHSWLPTPWKSKGLGLQFRVSWTSK